MKKPKTDKAEKEKHRAKVISAIGEFMSRISAQSQKIKQREKEKMLF